MEETSNKELLDRVRSLLQRDKIRLWEAPYTDPVTGAENLPDVRISTRFFHGWIVLTQLLYFRI